MLYLFLLGLVSWVCSEAVFYESFTGNVLTNEEVNLHIERNTTFWCVNEILPCDPFEGRRLDGSCNNLKFPSKGAPHTPMYRLLPAEYDKDFEPRTSKSGEPLPLVRSVRTGVLAEGRVPNSRFTILLTHFWVYITVDLMSVHDTVNFLMWKPHCCEEKGKTDRECVPIMIPDDDPVHRFSTIRCMSFTRPMSFQSVGCLNDENTTPEGIFSTTPFLDLSHFYGISLQTLNKKSRQFERGLLKIEVENGKIWPPSVKGDVNICALNELPHETRCHDTPDMTSNTILGNNLFEIWTRRLHNRFATVLSALNPCWNDDKLFFTTREIVIAVTNQIQYYEMMPALMGYENLVREVVISPDKNFRDLYDENILPQISLEFTFVQRWAHTLQEGKLKMYDENGHYLKEHRLVNMTFRTGYLVDNLEYITQGAFRQPAAKYDYIVDPDIAETAFGGIQLAADLLSLDLSKNRYLGFSSYIKYRKLCSGKTYSTFEDLLDSIDPQGIELLKEKYKHFEDIDLLAGIWLEKPVKGGHVPVTLFCVMVEQMRRMVVSDRHWYERPNRPNAFTLQQLLQVRKASIAQFMCAVGDTVTEIQPHAFLLPGKGNEIRSCNEIEKINLYPWEDSSCNVKQRNTLNTEV